MREHAAMSSRALALTPLPLLKSTRVTLSIARAEGDTALHVAASHHMAEAVGYLLEKGADPNAMNNVSVLTCTVSIYSIAHHRWQNLRRFFLH